MTQLTANFFYDNSGSINATFTDTDGNTGSIYDIGSQSDTGDALYGFTDVDYESVKIYTGSCALQPIVTGSGFFLASTDNYMFAYSLDGRRVTKKYVSLPTTASKVGPNEYSFSGFTTFPDEVWSSYLPVGAYGDGTLIIPVDCGIGCDIFAITDDLGKTWRFSITPGYAAYLDDADDYYNSHIKCMAYGNGTFIAFDWNSNRYYSTDKGYTWNISEGSVKPSENYQFDKINIETYMSSQIVFDGSKFIQCGPHYEYDRDGSPYRVILGRYSYDGIIWRNFLPQNEFLVDVINSDGFIEKQCNLITAQLFTVGTSTFVCTTTKTQIAQYEDIYERHIRRVYSSSIANDDTIVNVAYKSRSEVAADNSDGAFYTPGWNHVTINGGTSDCVYLPGYTTANVYDGGKNWKHYIYKFNPSTNSISSFMYYEYNNDGYSTNKPKPWGNVCASLIGYNRDNNTFLIGNSSNSEEFGNPMFNITNEINVGISRLSSLRYPSGYYDHYYMNRSIIPIQSSILSGSIPPTSSAEPPTNQYFASASLISSLYFTVTGSNVNAATESIDPPMSASATVWYKWTPTEATGSSVYSITTLGSDFDTVLYLFKLSGSDAIENLVQQEWNDDYKGFSSTIDVAITGSETYYICVGGHNGDQGNYILSSSYVNPPPENDNYTTAFIMTGSSGVVTGSNRYATNEYVDGSTEYANVWWKWTPTTTKSTTIDLSGSNFPIACYVYTRLNDTWQWETSVFSTRTYTFISGSTYYFSVGGQNEGVNYRGNIRLAYT